MEAHPDSDNILCGIKRFKPSCGPWTGVVFRATGPKYFNAQALTSGQGSSKEGGRWSPKGTRAVYGSLTPETAMAETLRRYREGAIPIELAMPRVFVAIRVSVSQALDLRGMDLEGSIGASMTDLLLEDWRAQQQTNIESRGQSIGRAACTQGIEALIVPSAADSSGVDVVLFPDVLKPGSSVIAHGAL
jgi:RES domain-containing protein